MTFDTCSDIWNKVFESLPKPKVDTNPSFIQPPQAPSWIWRGCTFAGEFGDAFIMNTNLEGGDVPSSIEILMDVLLPLANTQDLSSKFLPTYSEKEIILLKKIIEEFKVAAKWGKALFKMRNRPQMFLQFLNKWVYKLQSLEIGERLIINGGWLIQSITTGGKNKF